MNADKRTTNGTFMGSLYALVEQTASHPFQCREVGVHHIPSVAVVLYQNTAADAGVAAADDADVPNGASLQAGTRGSHTDSPDFPAVQLLSTDHQGEVQSHPQVDCHGNIQRTFQGRRRPTHNSRASPAEVLLL